MISMIVHHRRRHVRRGTALADRAHDEHFGRSREDSEVIVLQVQVRVHEDR